jgi:FMN phosphatase YigB (HAD superfamily)
MVGDSLRHDVEGAIRAGMRGVLLHRGGAPDARADELGVPVIRSLHELPALLIG